MEKREKLMIKNNKKRSFNTFGDFVLTAFPKKSLKLIHTKVDFIDLFSKNKLVILELV